MDAHLLEHFSDQIGLHLANHCSSSYYTTNRIANCNYLDSNFNYNHSSHHSSSRNYNSCLIGTLSTKVEHFMPGPLAQATALPSKTIRLMQNMVVFVQSH